jgi:hypothetical protein
MRRRKFWKFLRGIRRMLYSFSSRNLLRRTSSIRNCSISQPNPMSSTHPIIQIRMTLIMIMRVLWNESSRIFQKRHSSRNSLKRKWFSFREYSFSLRFFVKEVVNKLRIIFGNKLLMTNKRKSKLSLLTSLNSLLLNWKDYLLISKYP